MGAGRPWWPCAPSSPSRHELGKPMVHFKGTQFRVQSSGRPRGKGRSTVGPGYPISTRKVQMGHVNGVEGGAVTLPRGCGEDSGGVSPKRPGGCLASPRTDGREMALGATVGPLPELTPEGSWVVRAYPLGPRFAGPRARLAGGRAPSDPHGDRCRCGWPQRARGCGPPARSAPGEEMFSSAGRGGRQQVWVLSMAQATASSRSATDLTSRAGAELVVSASHSHSSGARRQCGRGRGCPAGS